MIALGSGEGLPQLWERLARPYDPAPLVASLLGFPHSVAEQLIGVVLATCDETEDLLDAMPQTLRSLAIATTDRPQRCYGEIRGPVMWAETVAARASSAGDPGVFVCSTPDKAFDTDENRVLVAALGAIKRAVRSMEGIGHDYDDAVIRRARHNGTQAIRYLEHRTLSTLPRLHRPTPRAVHRTRSGTRRRTYLPALRLLQRMSEPLDLTSVEVFCDERTTAQHDLLANVIAEVESRGAPLKPLRVMAGNLASGPISYRHSRSRGDTERVHGILVGEVLIDVPDSMREADRRRAEHDLAERSHGHRVVSALEPADVRAAVDLAVDLGLTFHPA